LGYCEGIEIDSRERYPNNNVVTEIQSIYNCQNMKSKDRPQKEITKILKKYLFLIKSLIQKHNPQKIGIDVDDLLQEVLIKLWNVLKNEKKIIKSTFYISRVTNSVLIDQIRSLKRFDAIVDNEKHRIKQTNYSNNPSEYSGKLYRAVNQLNNSKKKVVKLYLLGLSIKEISEMLDWSESNTKNLLYRGINDLKEILVIKEPDDES